MPAPPAPSRHYRKADSQTTLTSTLSSSLGPPSSAASGSDRSTVIDGLNKLEPNSKKQNAAAAIADGHGRYGNHKDRAMEMEIQQVRTTYF